MQDPQVTVASSFLIILLQKPSSPLQVPISNPSSCALSPHNKVLLI